MRLKFIETKNQKIINYFRVKKDFDIHIKNNYFPKTEDAVMRDGNEKVVFSEKNDVK